MCKTIVFRMFADLLADLEVFRKRMFADPWRVLFRNLIFGGAPFGGYFLAISFSGHTL